MELEVRLIITKALPDCRHWQTEGICRVALRIRRHNLLFPVSRTAIYAEQAPSAFHPYARTT
jgi:hypothetical protein